MEDGELRARVKRALERRSAKARRLKEFYHEIALAADSSVSAATNWRVGVCVPDSASLLNLFDRIPGFEAEVRGTGGCCGNGHDLTNEIAQIESILAALKARNVPKVPARTVRQRRTTG